MDGFDDLLPSRSVLEQNPFEDPFSQRSNSPDPWASFHQSNADSPFAEHNAFGSSITTPALDHHDVFGGSSSTAAGFAHFDESNHVETPESAAAENASLIPQHDGEPRTPSIQSGSEALSTRSPGFKESVSHTIEETVSLETGPLPPSPTRSESPTPAPKHAPEPLLSVSLASPPESPTTSTTSIPPPVSAPAAYTPPGQASPPPPTTSPTTQIPASAAPRQSAFSSPLEQQTHTLHSSFSGLALGGESLGGWQSTSNAWGGSSSAIPTSTSAAVEDDDDDDDDKPILQSKSTRSSLGDKVQALVADKSSHPAPKDSNGIQPVFVITVDDPQRVGDPIRAYTMYTVHTKTTSPLYSKSSFSVLRRYSDFLWLYETLSMNNPGVVVPPAPEKNPFGRFDSSFVEQRRLALEKCIGKIANHPVLQKDTDLKLFLESDTFALDIKHRKAEIAHEKGGLMASIGQTIAGPRFYETDEWFDKQKSYLDSLELQLKGLVKSIDLVSKQRMELSIATADFAQTLTELSTSDIGKNLSAAIAGLAEVERKAQDLQSIQSQDDMITIMSTADEYARLINSVRLAFNSRIRTYHAWQNADSNVKKVKQQHEANRSGGRLPSDQLSRSLQYVAEAERRALDAKQEFEHVSKLVKNEVGRFEKERIEDFKTSLEAFLEGMIARQKELIGAWEAFQQSLLKRSGMANNAQQQQPRPVDGLA
ncbi:hypothetical protein ABKN59_007781 [Abortiporus biennis]